MNERATHLPQEPVARLDRIHRGAPNGEKRFWDARRKSVTTQRLEVFVADRIAENAARNSHSSEDRDER